MLRKKEEKEWLGCSRENNRYFDSLGVTSRFNINLLNRMNRELGANFDVTKWQHRAVWNGNV